MEPVLDREERDQLRKTGRRVLVLGWLVALIVTALFVLV